MNKFEVNLPETVTTETREKVLKWSLQVLQNDTGLDFTDQDCARLGNLEWAVLTASDPYERPLVKVGFDKRDDSATVDRVRVNFAAGSVLDGTTVMVRCRTISSHEITGDTIKTIDLQPGSLQTTDFPAGEALTKALVSVWRQQDAVWQLWAEIECSPIQAIAYTVAFENLHGNAPIQRLAPYASSKKYPEVPARVQAVQSLTRRHYESSMVGSLDTAPWSSSAGRLQQQVKGWFGPPSGAQFFLYGQGKDGFGVLEFAEWFKKLLGGPDLGRVVIADPFFDALGVDHIMGAEIAGLHCQVITHSELRTSDETDTTDRSPGDLSPRARRLQQACSLHQPYLSGISFEILDLRRKRSTSNSPRPIFHDRMIVRLDKESRLLDGYHLSNSLQSAAANYPFLATRIPSDTLLHVWAYVQQLEQGMPPLGDPDAYEVVKLIDTGTRPELPIVSEDELMRQTKLVWGQASFLPDDESALLAHLPQLTARLEAVDDETFSTLWTALTVWAYNSLLWNETVTGLAESAPLLERLEAYFVAYSAEGMINESVAQVLSFLGQPFKAALQPAPEHLLERLWDVRLRAGGLREAKLAACVLLKGTPESFVRALDARSSLSHLGGPVTAVALSCLAERLPFAHTGLLRALHLSNTPALRALSVMHLPASQRRDKPLDFERALQHLNLLPEEEQILSLAYWLASLGLTALPRTDIDQSRLDPRRVDLRSNLYQELLRRWRHVDEADLRRTVLKLNFGRVGCVKVITEDLFLPLIEQERLSYEQVADLWVGFFLDPLENALSTDTGEVPYISADDLNEQVFSIALVISQTKNPLLWLERIQKLLSRTVQGLKVPLVRLRRNHFGSLTDIANRGFLLCDALLAKPFSPETKTGLELLQSELNTLLKQSELNDD